MKIPLTKWTIDFSSFIRKGVPKVDQFYGVWFVTGKQGSGKTYNAVEILTRIKPLVKGKVYTNIHSLKIEHEDFTKLTEILTNTEQNCVFIIDEVSKKYDRNSKTDTQFYAWLQQSRKRSRIVILITQEWRELPMWLRRPAKYMITMKKTMFLGWANFITTITGDAENLVFNKDEGEYECPPIAYRISKRNKKIASLYDTFEPINDL